MLERILKIKPNSRKKDTNYIILRFTLVESFIIASIFLALLPRIQLIRLRNEVSVLRTHRAECLPLCYDGKKYRT
jgi:hypothetical protein